MLTLNMRHLRCWGMSRRIDPDQRKVTTSITLRPDLLARLDETAARLDRSRNWTAECALRSFLETNSTPRIWTAPAVAERAPPGGAVGSRATLREPPAAT
jgi:hypothetical protein